MQITKIERPFRRPVSSPSSTAELETAVTWLSEHLGFPAKTREQFEARVEPQRPR